LCCVFVLFFFILFDLCCQFLWIVQHIIETETTSKHTYTWPLTHIHDHSHIYMTAHTYTWPLTHIHDRSLKLRKCTCTSKTKWRDWTSFIGQKSHLFVTWCGHASDFPMRVKCEPSHITGWTTSLCGDFVIYPYLKVFSRPYLSDSLRLFVSIV
jgi:hypothetical protein